MFCSRTQHINTAEDCAVNICNRLPTSSFRNKYAYTVIYSLESDHYSVKCCLIESIYRPLSQVHTYIQLGRSYVLTVHRLLLSIPRVQTFRL